MLHDPVVLDVLEALPRAGWQGIVFRHLIGSRSPELANQLGARWNPPGIAALYTSLEKETARAEGDHVIATQPVRPRGQRSIYRIEAALESVLDVRDSDLRDALELPDSVLEADEWDRCQQVGAAVAWLGHEGLLVPSVRREGGSNLVLFTGNCSAAARIGVLGCDPL